MPLSFEQFQDLRAKGLSVEQIIRFENGGTPTDKIDHDFSMAKMMGNIPSSTAKFGKDVVGAVTSPVQTAKALGGTVLGGLEKIFPGQQGHEQQFDAMADFFKDRYGSIDKFQKTLEEDPVGVLADLSAAFSGVGGAGRIASRLGVASQRVGRVAEAVSRAGSTIDPLNIAGRAIAAGVPRVIPAFRQLTDRATEAAAARHGVDLPMSARTESGFLQVAEQAVAKGPFGERLIQRFNNAMDQVRGIANTAIERMNAAPNIQAAGQAVIDGLNNFRQRFIDEKNRIYSLIPDNELRGIQIQAPQTAEFLQRIISELRGSGDLASNPPSLRFYQGLMNGLTNRKRGTASGLLNASGRPLPAPTLNTANAFNVRSFLKNLNKKLSPGSDFVRTGDPAINARLAATLSRELDLGLTRARPDLGNLLRDANAFFSNGIDVLNQNLTSKISKYADHPDKVWGIIDSPGTSINEMNLIMGVLDDNQRNMVRATALSELMRKASPSGEGMRPMTLSTILNNPKNLAKMQAVYTPQQMNTIRDISRLSRSLGRASKLAGGSQTGFINNFRSVVRNGLAAFGGASAATGGGVFGFIPFMMMLTSEYGMARFLSSAVGQRALLEGIDLTRRIPQAAQQTRNLVRSGLETAAPVTRTAVAGARINESQEPKANG